MPQDSAEGLPSGPREDSPEVQGVEARSDAVTSARAGGRQMERPVRAGAGQEPIAEHVQTAVEGLLKLPQNERIEALRSIPSRQWPPVLSLIPPQDRDAILSELTEEEQQQLMEEGAEVRVEEATATKNKTAEERVKMIRPDMPEEVKNVYRSLDDLMYGEESLSDQRKDRIKKIFQDNKFSKENARMFIEDGEYPFAQNPNTVNELIAGLQTEAEMPQEALTDAEQSQVDQGRAEATVLEDALGQANDSVLAELNDTKNPPSPERRKELERYQRKAGFLTTKLQDFFAEGEKGNIIAKRTGKVLYYALLTAIVLFLLEMNIIYKASKRK